MIIEHCGFSYVIMNSFITQIAMRPAGRLAAQDGSYQ